jgi:predicted amidohydrolase YtcJ
VDAEISTLFYGGPILTMDPRRGSAEALLASGDKILSVGGLAAARKLAPRDARRVDLKGRALAPAFIDGHGHFLSAGRKYAHELDLRPSPFGKADSVADILKALKVKAAQTPPGEWIRGFGYDDTLLRDKRHPLAGDLDAAAPQNPVALEHVSGHFLAVNSRALKLAGYGPQTPDPPGGKIRRLSDGSPSGLLEEPPAMDPVEALFPPKTLAEEYEALRLASREWAKAGVATAQEGWATQRDIEIYLKALEEEDSPLAVRVQILPGEGRVDLDALPRLSGTALDPGRRLTLGPVKLFADGSLQGFTGHLSNPYHATLYDHPYNYRGYAMVEGAVLRERVLRRHLEGRQIAIHGNGDAGIEDILQAFEEAQRAFPRANARHIVIHCQTVREDQLDRMKRLGVAASFFAVHVRYWGDRHRDVFLGEDRARRLNPLKSALEREIPFSLHNDCPVTPISPLASIETAVTRLTSSRAALGPEYRIGVEEALAAVTSQAAYLAFEENSKGTLAPGFLADLCVLGRDPRAEPPEKIAEIEVLVTLAGGRVIYGEI